MYVTPVIEPVENVPVPISRFSVKGGDKNIILTAFEMGTEAGGLILESKGTNPVVKKFILIDADTKEYISDLVDLDVVSEYSLYYLRNQVSLEAQTTRNFEMQAVVFPTRSEDFLEFAVVGLYGVIQDGARIQDRSVSIAAKVFMDPKKEIRVNFIIPPEHAVIAVGPLMDIEFSIFYPSAFLKEGEKPGFSVRLCPTKEDSLGRRSCVIEVLSDAYGYLGKPLFQLDHNSTIELSLDLDEERRNDFIKGAKPIPNGEYELTVYARKLTPSSYNDGRYLYGHTPFGSRQIISIQR